MSKYLTALPLCAALALTAPMTAFAQSTAPATASEEETTAPAATDTKPQPGTSGNAAQIEEQLSLGQDADADQQMGKP